MFRKLVSNIPFNPSLFDQVVFYARRLNKETAIRRTGMIFTVMALIVQTLTVLIPPQASLATSENDIVYGAASKATILSAYQNNRDGLGRTDIQSIYGYYGITYDDVAAAITTTVKSRERNYTTTGRGRSNGPDTFTSILGAKNGGIFERSLNVWDIKNYENCYKGITGTASGEGILKGRTFWILLGNCGSSSGGCGNVTFEAFAPEPVLEVVKTRTSPSPVVSGGTVTYRIDFRNSGRGMSTGTIIHDTLEAEFEFISQSSTIPMRFIRNGQFLRWEVDAEISSLAPSTAWHSVNIELRAAQINEPSKRVCNIAWFASTQNQTGLNTENPESERCVVIEKPVCPGSGLPIPDGGINNCTISCPDGSTVTYTQACPVPKCPGTDLPIPANGQCVVSCPDGSSVNYNETCPIQKCPGTDLVVPAGGLSSCMIECLDGSQVTYDKTCPLPPAKCPGTDLPIPANGQCVVSCPDGSSVNYTETCPIPKCPGTDLVVPQDGVCTIGCPDGSIVTYSESCPVPTLSCTYLTSLAGSTWDERTYNVSAISQPGGKIKTVQYFINDSLVHSAEINGQSLKSSYLHRFGGEGSFVVRAEIIALVGTVQITSGCTLNETVTKPETGVARLVKEKGVSNITKNLTDANNTNASSGDILEYSIFIYNRGNADQQSLELAGEYAESIKDILEYSTLLEYGDAVYDESTQFLSWPAVTIPAGSFIKKTFKVQIKDPLPSTPVSASDPLSYDFVLNNEYGNKVTIKLSKTPLKQTEITVTQLPNTGPGTSLLISFFGAMFIAYFFFRSRLLAKEMNLVKLEFQEA